MKRLQLDTLLSDRYLEASFHDSDIESITFDFLGHTAALAFKVPVGLEGKSYVMRAGVLRVSGLHSFSAETPAILYGHHSDALDITWEGALPDPNLKISLEVPSNLPETAFCHAFFVSNTNSFFVIAGEDAYFEWLP